MRDLLASVSSASDAIPTRERERRNSGARAHITSHSVTNHRRGRRGRAETADGRSCATSRPPKAPKPRPRCGARRSSPREAPWAAVLAACRSTILHAAVRPWPMPPQIVLAVQYSLSPAHVCTCVASGATSTSATAGSRLGRMDAPRRLPHQPDPALRWCAIVFGRIGTWPSDRISPRGLTNLWLRKQLRLFITCLSSACSTVGFVRHRTGWRASARRLAPAPAATPAMGKARGRRGRC